MPTLRRPLPVFVVAAAHVFAQEPAPAPKDARLLPLQAGNRWAYEVKTLIQQWSDPVRSVVHDEGGTTLADGRIVHQLRVENAGAAGPRFEHWSVDEHGVQRLLPRDAAVRGEVDLDAAPLEWLRLDGTDTWQWQGAHDLARDEQGRPWLHRAKVTGRDVQVAVPAGVFRTVQVEVRSERDGVTQMNRSLWFAPGIGIVRDDHRDALRLTRRELVSFTPGQQDRDARMRAHLVEELANPKLPAWNNPPYLTWVEAGPEVLAVPGRIAIARGEGWTRFYYVDEHAIRAIVPAEADRVAVAARAAFGTESAMPPDTQPLRPLALLLARAEAARQQLGRVHEVPLSLQPPRALRTDSHRQVAVELRGGALDGTTRRVAVWLTVAHSTDIQIHSETERAVADTRR